MTVEKFSFDQGDVLVAEVQPSEFPPVRYRGRIWVRVGPRKSIATEAEEKYLLKDDSLMFTRLMRCLV